MRVLAPALLLFAATAIAQIGPLPPAHPPGQAAAEQPDQAQTLRIGTNLVYVPTQVQTKKGDILYDLKPDQFLLEDNGVKQTIRIEQSLDAQGLSLVVVVQCSRGAYAEFERMRGLGDMVDDVTGDAPHQVALVSYGNEPDLLTGFTDDPKKLGDAFGQLQPCDDGGAVTLEAVDYAIHLFDDKDRPAAKGNRRAILLISETRDHGSQIKPAEVVANLGRTNTVVDAVSFEPGKESIANSLLHGQMGPGAIGLIVMAVQALKRNVPETLAELSGGEYTVFASANKFDAGIHKLANHIHNFYLISFVPTSDTPGLHRLQVKIPDYPDARIHARLTYYQGNQPPPDIPEKDKH